MAFYKRNLAFFKLAVLSNIEYRLNFIIDSIVQPCLTALVEVFLWIAIFDSVGKSEIAGFSRDYYISYAIWATFFARITANWMYEFRMCDEIESGSINTLLVRPLTFFEYYLSQLLGYKFITTATSLIAPFLCVFFYDLPTYFERLPIVILLVFYYLILVHSISFLVATFAFSLNRVHYITTTKNIILWVLTGELFPIDLCPEPFRSWLTYLPFSNGVYIPVGYLTGRLEFHHIINGFISITIGLLVVNVVSTWNWKRGLQKYVGTGA